MTGFENTYTADGKVGDGTIGDAENVLTPPTVSSPVVDTLASRAVLTANADGYCTSVAVTVMAVTLFTVDSKLFVIRST